ncbi:MAG: O-methyltransferase [Cetobacterium sp.]
MLDELKDANSYVISKIEEKDPLILEMEAFALENNVPIITKEVAKYLEFLVSSHNFKNILEIGTAIGYSGTIMGRIAKKNGGNLTTIEIDEIRYSQALENFEKANLLDSVNLILGDGTVEVKKLNEKFDFIFIDASKGHYMEFFNDSFTRLSDNGMIFIDNIMFRGYLYKEYPKRFKTIVRRLDEFITYLSQNHDFVLLPFGDGIGLVKKY